MIPAAILRQRAVLLDRPSRRGGPTEFAASYYGTPHAWWDPSDTSTITLNSGTVASMTDKSGNGRTVQGGTTSNSPKSGTRSHNGLNVLDFDGGDDLDTVVAYSWPQPSTLLIVAKTDQITAAKYMFGSESSSNPSGFGIDLNTTYKWRVHAGSALWGPDADTDPHIFTVFFSGASSYLRKDGVQVATGNPGTSNPTSGVLLGGFGGFALLWDGWIGDCAHYSGAIDLAAEEMLATKWGL